MSPPPLPYTVLNHASPFNSTAGWQVLSATMPNDAVDGTSRWTMVIYDGEHKATARVCSTLHHLICTPATAVNTVMMTRKCAVCP